jgi:ankyrin repeat protein
VETAPDSPLDARFETAVEALINGRADDLRALVRDAPDLVRARSTIVTKLNPPAHRATLLHYIAANGVEEERQKSPPNSVEIATILLEAGAEPDALADMYGGQLTTMTMLVSSVHPAAAGVQVPLVDTLVDFGAEVNGRGSGDWWVPPLLTALAFRYPDAAQALVRRGASVNTLAAAAGLGRLADSEALLPTADALDRHRALALAAQYGHTEVARLLVDAGEDPNRFNPIGFHSMATPLHQAAFGGYLDTVQFLVSRGARVDVLDAGHHATPLGWAEHGQRSDVVRYLRSL